MLGLLPYVCLLAQLKLTAGLESRRTKQTSVRVLKGQRNPPMGSLHDVVGPDGVLLIHLERSNRTQHEELNSAGIYPTLIAATDAKTAAPEDLRNGCLSHFEEDTPLRCTGFDRSPGGTRGEGCMNPTEQAIAESHRQALLAAQRRNATWTAILVMM